MATNGIFRPAQGRVLSLFDSKQVTFVAYDTPLYDAIRHGLRNAENIDDVSTVAHEIEASWYYRHRTIVRVHEQYHSINISADDIWSFKVPRRRLWNWWRKPTHIQFVTMYNTDMQPITYHNIDILTIPGGSVDLELTDLWRSIQ